MTMQHKTFKTEIKAVTEEGDFEAVIATLGVIDSDGDIIEKGAFSTGPVSIQPAHDNRALPLGKGRIEEQGNLATVKGKMNLSTQSGREWHSHLKFDLENPPAVQEWSFGFMVKERSEETRDGESVRILKALDVFEVSPVLLGAGVGTTTLAVKSRRLVDHADEVIKELDDLATRVADVKKMRESEGKKLGEGRREQVNEIREKMGVLLKGLDDIAEEQQQEQNQEPELTPEERAVADMLYQQSAPHLTED